MDKHRSDHDVKAKEDEKASEHRYPESMPQSAAQRLAEAVPRAVDAVPSRPVRSV